VEELNYRIISPSNFLSSMLESLQTNSLNIKNILLGRIHSELGEYDKALGYLDSVAFGVNHLLDQFWAIECIYFKGKDAVLI
jgi:hypothetical protein